MNWKREGWKLALIAGVFLACFFMPEGLPRGGSRLPSALWESLHLVLLIQHRKRIE